MARVMEPQAPLERMIAVAPALNFTGQADFDPIAVASLMTSELSHQPGIGVVGVSRVLAMLAEDGVDRIHSPEHAVRVCERLGADAILVFAITEYDPYTPVVGMAAQLYGSPPPAEMFDPVTTSRLARPFPVVTGDEAVRPWAQVQRIFHAENPDIRRKLEAYAKCRSSDDSPYGWKKYLVSQQWYLRFCCDVVIHNLLHESSKGSDRGPQDMDVAMGEEFHR